MAMAFTSGHGVFPGELELIGETSFYLRLRLGLSGDLSLKPAEETLDSFSRLALILAQWILLL
jgi:hypothetical protein